MSIRLGPTDPVSSPLNQSTASCGSNSAPRSQKSNVGKEFFVYKILSSILWSIVLQCVYVSCVLLIMNINILHPFVWIRNTFSMVIRPGTWFYLIPLAAITLAQGVLMSKDFILGVPSFPTRFSFLCNLLMPRNILMALMNVVFGAMVVTYYSTLLNQEPGFLTVKCQESGDRCLSGDSLFLILNGMWISLYVFWQQCTLEARVLNFPMIQQLKYPQVKNRLIPMALRSIREAVLPTLYCVIFFAWYGSSISEHVASILSVSPHEDQKRSMTGFLVLQFWLLVRAHLCGAVIILIAHTMKFLFEVHLTDHTVFPISCVSMSRSVITLPDALSSPLVLLKHLAFIDLLFLSERDSNRRKELFSLSIPGGHPHNWNAVSGELLKYLQSFTDSLNAILGELNRGNAPASSSPQNLRTEQKRNLAATIPTRIHETPRLRNMSMLLVDQRESCNRVGGVGGASPPRPLRSVSTSSSFLDVVKKQVCYGLEWIRRKPGINYLFGEMTEARIRHLLITKGISVGCAAQTLSILAAASLTQDQYGIVQRDLPAILSTLIHLRCSLERVPTQSHKRALRGEAREERFRRSLLASVKRGLFAICGTFGDLLMELPLSHDVLQQLGGFVNYRES